MLLKSTLLPERRRNSTFFLLFFLPFSLFAPDQKNKAEDYFFVGLIPTFSSAKHSLDIGTILSHGIKSSDEKKQNAEKTASGVGIEGVLGWVTPVDKFLVGVELTGGSQPDSKHELKASYFNDLFKPEATVKFSQSGTSIRALLGCPISDKAAAFFTCGPTLCFSSISMSGKKGNITYKYESKNATGFTAGTFFQHKVGRLSVRLGYSFSYVPSFSTEVTGTYYIPVK